MAATVDIITNGTNTAGSNTKGKYPRAMLGCSKPNCSNLAGKESTAADTTFSSNARQIKFQARIAFLFKFFFTKPK